MKLIGLFVVFVCFIALGYGDPEARSAVTEPIPDLNANVKTSLLDVDTTQTAHEHESERSARQFGPRFFGGGFGRPFGGFGGFGRPFGGFGGFGRPFGGFGGYGRPFGGFGGYGRPFGFGRPYGFGRPFGGFYRPFPYGGFGGPFGFYG